MENVEVWKFHGMLQFFLHFIIKRGGRRSWENFFKWNFCIHSTIYKLILEVNSLFEFDTHTWSTFIQDTFIRHLSNFIQSNFQFHVDAGRDTCLLDEKGICDNSNTCKTLQLMKSISILSLCICVLYNRPLST